MQPTALAADPICRGHLAGRQHHPERPERFDTVLDGLGGAGLLDRLLPLESRAPPEEIGRAHACTLSGSFTARAASTIPGARSPSPRCSTVSVAPACSTGCCRLIRAPPPRMSCCSATRRYI